MATLPTSLFDEQWYLARNPDVAEAIAQGLLSSALEHFELFGKHEGRPASPLFNPEDYLKANPDVAEAVNAGTISAYDHFLQFGASEGRAPLSLFDPDFYLAQNPDVAAAVEAGLITATEHFLLYGQTEPRYVAPFINLGAYLNANSDVAQATQNGAVSPLVHLLTHGVEEGRNLGNGVDLSIFKNDPKFEEALASGNVQGALERVGEVAPFLPTFEPPANWEPAPDTPIPVDFTPPEGTKLVIPPSVVVPPDMELPEDIFEPVEPQPEPEPQPGGGGGGGGNPPRTPQILNVANQDVTQSSDKLFEVEGYSGKLGDKIVVAGYTANTAYPFIGTNNQAFVQTTSFQRQKGAPITQSKVGSDISGQADGLRLEFQRKADSEYVETGTNWTDKWPFVVDLRGFNLDGDYVHVVQQSTDYEFEAKIGNTHLTGASDVKNFLSVEKGAYNLTGGNDNDVLLGSTAANVLKGGRGNDILIGKGGGDTYDFTDIDVTQASGQVDEIQGYNGETDIILVSGYSLGPSDGNGGEFINLTAFQREPGAPINQSKVGSGVNGDAHGIRIELARKVVEGQNITYTEEPSSGPESWTNKWPGVIDLRGFNVTANSIYIRQNDPDKKFDFVIGGTDLTAKGGYETVLMLYGNTEGKTLTGSELNDTLIGNEKSNTDDFLIGGAGADTLIGHGGEDTFVYTAAGQGGNVTTVASGEAMTAGDVILDFKTNEDKISVLETLSTSAKAVGNAGPGNWDLDVHGVLILKDADYNFIAGVTTAADIAAVIGKVVGQEGARGYIAIHDKRDTPDQDADDEYHIFEVTLAADHDGELNGDDTISLLATVKSGTISTGDFIVALS